MTASDDVFKRCADARYRNIGGEGVVVLQAAGEVLVLNTVGARILDLLQSDLRVGALVATLSIEYDVDRATLELDVPAYLQELLEAGVIEHVVG